MKAEATSAGKNHRPARFQPFGRKCPGLSLALATTAVLGFGGGLGGHAQSAAGSDDAARTEITHVVEDHFGVAHPGQILTFPSHGPRRAGVRHAVLDENGRPVVHQWLRNGDLAVRLVGGLPAQGRRVWRVREDGPQPVGEDGESVVVTEGPTTVEITNGLLGVRVPAFPRVPDRAPAPIQAIRLRDGTWVSVGDEAVLLSKGSEAPLRVHGAALEFVERGPLRVTVKIAYRVDRSGIAGIVEDGVGTHETTITVEAGQPSILIEQDSDVDASYLLDLSGGFAPDEARFQGHSVSSPEHGRRADGSAYPVWHERSNEDAVVSLPLAPSAANPFGRYLPRWDPWTRDNGWYWQFYRRADAPAANLVGLFAGPASRVVGAQHSGVRIEADRPGRLALRVDTERGRPPARVWPRNRFAWGIYLGTKEDLRPTTQPQPIVRQMSLHAGINLNKLVRYGLEAGAFESPPAGLYLPGASIRQMIARLRAEAGGPSGAPYLERLRTADPALVELWEAWADTTGDAARRLAEALAARARQALDAFVNGHGIYSFHHHYWLGGVQMSRDAAVMNGLLILADMDPAVLTAGQRLQLERIAILYAQVLWDDDFVPLHEGHGLNLGTPNMPVMQTGFRQTYALWLARHPAMRRRAEAVRGQVSALLSGVIHESGASIGSSGYILASLVPIVNTMQQLKVAGGGDPFAAEPRIARAAEYYLHLLTPRETRFGGRRKAVSFGDGNTMTTELWGQLGTGLRGVDDVLSERLMEGWRQAGAAHSFFYGSSVLKIDESLPGREPMLGDADFPGAFTVLRSGWSTPDETAAWLLNGKWYRDHYHCDLGAVMIYALGAPISIHFGSGYTPRMPGAWMQNVVVPEAALGERWDSDRVSSEDCFGNREQQTVRAAGLRRGDGWAAAFGEFEGAGMSWRRRVVSYRNAGGPPVLRIRDDFDQDAGAVKIASLTLMAQGAVDGPAGGYVPPRGAAGHPSAGPVIPLAAGVNRFRFHGQWGVDFEVYVVVGDAETQALIGEWGHTTNTAREKSEFLEATGRPFEERQYILRLRSAGPFDVVLVPYRGGERPADLAVTGFGSNLRLTRNGRTAELPLP